MEPIHGRVISSDDVSVAYEVRGEGHPALVFIHGWCCNRRYWDEQAEYFGKQFKVVTVDLGWPR
jgi:pimeloyl-ACP methyl ester carboxylesterase